MFVFKAAVVGAGTMGGEIAQTLAAADLAVVLKDVDQKFVDQGLAKAREVTSGQLQGLVKKEKLTSEQADAKLEETMARIAGTEMGMATLRPEKVVGFHYFYPASVMRLIEIVEGEETSEETVQSAVNF